MNKIIKSNLIYDGKIITVKKLQVVLENNEIVMREFVHHSQAVAMLPIMNNKIVLVEQFRIGASSTLLEIPAGLLEENEEIEECAKRELQEEIGFNANKLTFMGSYYLSPGYSDEIIHLYLCEELTPSKLKHDDDEFIIPVFIDKSDLSNLLLNEISSPKKTLDAKTYLALSLYLNFYKNHTKKDV